MKKVIFIFCFFFLCATIFAQSQEKIPDWMGDSIILLTKEFTGTAETINTLFSNPKESTNIKINTTDNGLQICHEVGTDPLIILKLDVTFKFSSGGTCFPSKLYYESPLTFQSETLTCSSPYSDSQSYGYLLGSLYQFLPLLYENK